MIMNAEKSAAQTSDCAFLLLTESCNLRCSHCYVEAAPAVGKHMPLGIVERSFDLFADLGIDDVRMTGGEPSIHPEFVRILDIARRRHIRVGLVSNGVKLLRRKRADEIFTTLSRCWISLYGTSAERHSAISRLPINSFYQTINQVGALAGDGCQIGLSVLASPGDSKDVAKLMLNVLEVGIKRLRILPIQPDGRASGSGISWSTWSEEVLEIAHIMKRHPMSPQFDVLTINDPFDLSDRFDTSNASCLLNSRKMWSITPDGGVYPCCFTVYSDLRLGHVMDSGILERMTEPAVLHSAGPACHGLQKSFWRDAVTKTVTCPIGSLDPRDSVLRDHATS